MITVAITGLGVVSPFGIGTKSFFDGLLSAQSAVRPIASFDASRLPVNHAAEVPVPRIEAAWLAAGLRRKAEDPAMLQAWKAGWFRDRKVAWALLAAQEAWEQAGLRDTDLEIPMSLGLGLEQALLHDFTLIFEQGAIQWCAEPLATLPTVRLRTPVDLTVRALKAVLGLGGQPTLHVSACAAGALAVAHGAALIRRGSTSLVLCGATDAMINPLGLGGMIRLGATSPRNSPEACRPFDRRRDGLAMGEGSAIFVLEAEGHAKARGARVLGRVRGWGSTQDGYRVTAPRPDGAAASRAIRRALDTAGLPPEALDYVNAHGTGTPLNDPAEAQAIHLALGDHAASVPVSSIKGAVGHLMAAAGALELAACLLPFERGFIPGTVHHQQPDPDCPLRVLTAEAVRHDVHFALSNSFGFGGQNASVILEAP